MADQKINGKWSSNWLAGFAIASVVFPMGLYFFIFQGKIARDQEIWAHFATFITAFASIANLFVVWSIAKEAKDLNKQSQKENRLFQDANEKPVLYLSQRLNSDKIWYISNIGRGAALNIKIAIEFLPFGSDSGAPEQIVKGYALAAQKDTLVVRSDFRSVRRFFVIYEDVRQRKFIAVANNHETITEEISELNKLVFDDEYVFDKAALDSLFKLKPTNPAAFSKRYQCLIFPESLSPIH